MAALNRQKCDKIMKLVIIEATFTRIVKFNSLTGFATTNIDNPDSEELIEKHIAAIRSAVSATKAFETLRIIPSFLLDMGPKINNLLTLMDELSETILHNEITPDVLSNVLTKYPELQDVLADIDTMIKMIEVMLISNN